MAQINKKRKFKPIIAGLIDSDPVNEPGVINLETTQIGLEPSRTDPERAGEVYKKIVEKKNEAAREKRKKRGIIQKVHESARGLGAAKPPLIPAKLGLPEKNPLQKWIRERKGSYDVTRQDVMYVYRNVIFGNTVKQLKAIMADQKKREALPVLVAAVIASVLGDIAKGNLNNMVKVLDFIFPAAKITFELEKGKGNGEEPDIEALENKLKKLEGDEGLHIIDKLRQVEDAEVTYAGNDN